jgi:hypothetical protein
MIVCHCSLAGTRAFLSCPQYQNMTWPHSHEAQAPPFIKTKRTIEEYDKEGNLIKKIIEE